MASLNEIEGVFDDMGPLFRGGQNVSEKVVMAMYEAGLNEVRADDIRAALSTLIDQGQNSFPTWAELRPAVIAAKARTQGAAVACTFMCRSCPNASTIHFAKTPVTYPGDGSNSPEPVWDCMFLRDKAYCPHYQESIRAPR